MYRRLCLTPLEPQSRFGDKLLEHWVVCPQNGTAVLKGLIVVIAGHFFAITITRNRDCIVIAKRDLHHYMYSSSSIRS